MTAISDFFYTLHYAAGPSPEAAAAVAALSQMRALASAAGAMVAAAGGAAGGASLAAAGGVGLICQGDSSPKPEDHYIAASPDTLRCLSNPYDTSATCVRARLFAQTPGVPPDTADDSRRARASGRGQPVATSRSAISVAKDPTATDAATGFNPLFGFWEVPTSPLPPPRFVAAGAPNKAEIPWKPPQEVPLCLPETHDPREVPDAVLQAFRQFARENNHLPTMLLWNPRTHRYELDASVLVLTVFPKDRQLVRVMMPTKYDFLLGGPGRLWQLIPIHDHLEIHHHHGLDPEGPITIHAVFDGVEVVATMQRLPDPVRYVAPEEMHGCMLKLHWQIPTSAHTEEQFVVLYTKRQGSWYSRLYFSVEDMMKGLRSNQPIPTASIVGTQIYVVQDELGPQLKVRYDPQGKTISLYMASDLKKTPWVTIPRNILPKAKKNMLRR